MKRIIIIIAVMLLAFVSCTKAEFGASINDIIGSEWSAKGENVTLGLKFYANGAVTSFVDNQHGIATVSGTYEYMSSTKMLSFKNLIWYDYETGEPSLEMTGARVLDSQKMEIVLRTIEGEVISEYMYRQ